MDIALEHLQGAVCVGGYLMGSADEVQVVAVEELTDDVGSEREWDAAVILSPALDVLVWVRPQEIAQEACKKNQQQQEKNPVILTPTQIYSEEEQDVIHHEFISLHEMTWPAVHRASPCHIYKVLRIKTLPPSRHTHSSPPDTPGLL